jgi:hypothetical protein
MVDPRLPLHQLNDRDLDQALVDLGTHLALPPTPEIASDVRRAIVMQPRPPVASIRQFPIRRVLMAAAIVILALVAALILVDGFRTTVADLFGVRGVRITIERDKATATVTGTQPATPVGPNLLLGQRLSLVEAQRLVDFPIGVPAHLGDPDEVYLRRLSDGTLMVSLLYQPRPGLPETAETGAGALIMQFETKQPVMYLGKQISEGEQLSFVEVHGRDAVWIDGIHTLALLTDPSRGCCDDTGRAAGNVLLWEQDNQTMRFESALTRAEAIAIAESFRYGIATPVPD